MPAPSPSAAVIRAATEAALKGVAVEIVTKTGLTLRFEPPVDTPAPPAPTMPRKWGEAG